jgi:hypothetical protein
MAVGPVPSSNSTYYTLTSYIAMSVLFSITFFGAFGSLLSLLTWEWHDFRNNRKEVGTFLSEQLCY